MWAPREGLREGRGANYKHAGELEEGMGAGGECWGAGNGRWPGCHGCVSSPSPPIQAESAGLLGVRRSLLPKSGVKGHGSFGLFGGSQPSLLL